MMGWKAMAGLFSYNQFSFCVVHLKVCLDLIILMRIFCLAGEGDCHGGLFCKSLLPHNIRHFPSSVVLFIIIIIIIIIVFR